jgi:hypothetical protein
MTGLCSFNSICFVPFRKAYQATSKKDTSQALTNLKQIIRKCQYLIPGNKWHRRHPYLDYYNRIKIKFKRS